MDDKVLAIEKQPPGWLCVSTRLEHLTVVTWAVEPARLRKHIPEPFELECVTLEDGTRGALVSAVTFLNRDFHLVRVPTPRLTLGQTNYRAYIRHEGQRAAWFLGTTIDTLAVAIPRFVWGMPWRRARYHFEVERAGDRGPYRRFEVSAKGQWPMRLSVEDSGEPLSGALTGFESEAQSLTVLTQPHVGFYQHRPGSARVGRYSIWHDIYSPRLASLTEARFDLLDVLDVVPIPQQQSPHSVILDPSVLYWIHLPPRRLPRP